MRWRMSHIEYGSISHIRRTFGLKQSKYKGASNKQTNKHSLDENNKPIMVKSSINLHHAGVEVMYVYRHNKHKLSTQYITHCHTSKHIILFKTNIDTPTKSN